MTCTEVLRDIGIGQRQIAGRGRNLITDDRDSTVMQRCVLLEDVDQQCRRHDTVDTDTGLFDFLQWLILLDHDECSGLLLRHLEGRTDDFVDRRHTGVIDPVIRNQIGDEVPAAELFQRFSELRLEDDDGRDDGRRRDPFDQPHDGREMKDRRCSDEGGDDQQTLEQLPGSRIFDPEKDLIYEHREDDDLEDVGIADRWQEAHPAFHFFNHSCHSIYASFPDFSFGIAFTK